MKKINISQIDSNFKTQEVDGHKIIYHSVMNKPFVFEGLGWKNYPYYRIPCNFTDKDVNNGVLELSHQTAGCCVRFRSNSKYIALKAQLEYSSDMNHMPRCGSSGFDLYIKNRYGQFVFIRAVQPNYKEIDLERIVYSDAPAKMNEYLLNFPLYGGAKEVQIGLDPDSLIEEATPHKIAKPILFYGSSITQGGCASRPGNVYTSILCRKLDAPQINLGFSGSAKGETAMAEAIASLDLSCFVMDYDHNAPDPEHLAATHEKFFKIIRKKNPKLPILIISKCDFHKGEFFNEERREIVRKTYENAVASGDKYTAFIDGETLWGKVNRDACSVDGCHPNDFGFYRMADKIYPVLKTLINKNNININSREEKEK